MSSKLIAKQIIPDAIARFWFSPLAYLLGGLLLLSTQSPVAATPALPITRSLVPPTSESEIFSSADKLSLADRDSRKTSSRILALSPFLKSGLEPDYLPVLSEQLRLSSLSEFFEFSDSHSVLTRPILKRRAAQVLICMYQYLRLTHDKAFDHAWQTVLLSISLQRRNLDQQLNWDERDQAWQWLRQAADQSALGTVDESARRAVHGMLELGNTNVEQWHTLNQRSNWYQASRIAAKSATGSRVASDVSEVVQQAVAYSSSGVRSLADGYLFYRLAEFGAQHSAVKYQREIIHPILAATLHCSFAGEGLRVFDSVALWTDFKNTHFHDTLANEQSAHFVRAWLVQIDRIVQDIEDLGVRS